MKDNNDFDLVCTILYKALVEIREDCASNKNKSFALSNLLHNLPLELKRLHNNEINNQEFRDTVLKELIGTKYKDWILQRGSDYELSEIYQLLQKSSSNTDMKVIKKDELIQTKNFDK